MVILMARRPKKRTARTKALQGELAQVRVSGSANKKAPKRKKGRITKNRKKTELVPMENTATTLIPARKQDSLLAWFNLYMGIEGGAGADNTFEAKKRDLEAFLTFLMEAAGTDQPDRAGLEVRKSGRSTRHCCLPACQPIRPRWTVSLIGP